MCFKSSFSYFSCFYYVFFFPFIFSLFCSWIQPVHLLSSILGIHFVLFRDYIWQCSISHIEAEIKSGTPLCKTYTLSLWILYAVPLICIAFLLFYLSIKSPCNKPKNDILALSSVLFPSSSASVVYKLFLSSQPPISCSLK